MSESIVENPDGNAVLQAAPEIPNKPPTPYFLEKLDTEEMRVKQDEAFRNQDLKWVKLKVLQTSSGDDTFYTGYLDGNNRKHGPGKIIYISSNEY